MAAIIAQITRANRERKKRNETLKKIKPGKCMNDIEPFDETFDPKVSTFLFFVKSNYVHTTIYFLSFYKSLT